MGFSAVQPIKSVVAGAPTDLKRNRPGRRFITNLSRPESIRFSHLTELKLQPERHGNPTVQKPEAEALLRPMYGFELGGRRYHRLLNAYYSVSRYELDTLRRLFLDLAGRSHGKYIDKGTFLKLFQMPGILGERLFAVFDQHRNGSIDYDEFIGGLGAFIRGDLDEKISFLFCLYDVGNHGSISRQELSTVLNSVIYGGYLIVTSAADPFRIPDNVTQFIDKKVKRLVDDAFRDKTDDALTKDEFKRWVLDNPEVLDIIEFLIRERRTRHQATVSSQNRMTFDKIMHTPTPQQAGPDGISEKAAREEAISGSFKATTLSFEESDTDQSRDLEIQASPMQSRLRNELFSGSGDSEQNGFHLSDSSFLRQQTEPFIGEMNGSLGYMEGWLNKKSRFFPIVGHNRWVVLRDNFLYLFASQTDTQPISVICLEGCYADPVISGGHYGLEINSPISNVVRQLFCEDQASQQRWLQSIQFAARQFRLEEYYDIGARIGVGRFSNVFVCTRKTTGDRYAVKIIEKKGVDPRDLDALRTEIAVLQYVHHPNIVHLKNVFETKTQIFILMTLISGGELFDRIKAVGRFPEPAAKIVTKQILLALKYLHERGIIHRDLKPENIMMVSEDLTDFRITLVDFGLSKFIAPDETLRQRCGTLAYVAPEVLQARPYGHEVDLWSVGVIAYAMLRNRLPFADADRSALEKALRWQVPMTDPVWKQISEEAKHFVRQLLNPDPSKRYTIDQALTAPWMQTTPTSTRYPDQRIASL